MTARINWTPELDGALVTLWTSNLSADQIARKFPIQLSRNAIIGRAHRLGLPHRPRNPQRSLNARAPKIEWTEEMDSVLRENWSAFGCGAKMVELLNVSSPSISLRARKLGLPKRPRNKGRVHIRTRRAYVPPAVLPPLSYKRIEIHELEANHCRYPMWNAESDPKHYCGNDKAIGSSYCPYHHRVVWRSE